MCPTVQLDGETLLYQGKHGIKIGKSELVRSQRSNEIPANLLLNFTRRIFLIYFRPVERTFSVDSQK